MPLNVKKCMNITLIGTPEDLESAINKLQFETLQSKKWFVISSEVSPKNKNFYIVKMIKEIDNIIKDTAKETECL